MTAIPVDPNGRPAEDADDQAQTERSLMPLMSIEEVAEHLRVPVLTVRWLRQEGRFAPAVKVGRRLAWERSEVASWVKSQREDVA